MLSGLRVASGLLAYRAHGFAYYVVVRRGKTPPLTPPQHGEHAISDARSSPSQSCSRIARMAPPTSSSFAEEKRLRSLLLSTASTRLATLAAL